VVSPGVRGYRRENGSVGVRNHVVVLPVDDLSNAACQSVAHQIKGVLALPHAYGRLQYGADLDLHFRTMIGTGSKIVRRPLPENDPRQRQPNISLAKRQLSWEPRTQLKEGLGRTIAYFEKLLAESSTRQILTKV